MKNRIVVLGGGESGVGAAILAQTQGFDVFVSDKQEIKAEYRSVLIERNIAFEEKQHTSELILSADEVIKSPGIPDSAPIVKSLREKGTAVISEIEFAGRYTNAVKVCITGSNGKTTTTMLIYHILKNAGLNVGLAGNVGKSFAWQVAESNFDYYVLELSSFQLDGMHKFKAEVSILMNITPDHLDRYDYNFQNYVDSKFRITQNQTQADFFVYCADDDVILQELKKREDLKVSKVPFSVLKTVQNGAYADDNHLYINHQNTNLEMPIQDLAIKGKHNVYNSMAASLAAKLLEIRKEHIRESLMTFKSVEHRLEFVLRIRGVEYINDSKATNVNSTWYALESMSKPTIWIVGGIDKGNDYSALYDLVKDKVKAIVCMGADNSKIIKAFDGMKPIADCHSMEEAMKVAYGLGENGDTVLLSPCCASFDLFENYEDRGNQFKEAVRNL